MDDETGVVVVVGELKNILKILHLIIYLSTTTEGRPKKVGWEKLTTKLLQVTRTIRETNVCGFTLTKLLFKDGGVNGVKSLH